MAVHSFEIGFGLEAVMSGLMAVHIESAKTASGLVVLT